MVLLKKATDFQDVLGQYTALVHKICRSYAFTKEDREDLFQEIALQLWRSFDKYDSTYQYSTWIYRIALNVAISHSRKRQRYRKQQEDIQGPEPVAPITSEIDAREKLDQLYRLIHAMNELDRALMILYLEEKSYEEISEITGLTTTNVATKISRLKSRLQKQFGYKN